MIGRLARHITTVFAAFALAVAMAFAPAAAAPDRDDAARLASVLALGGVWSDICGTEDPAHRDCPFCTLNSTPQRAAPIATSDAGFIRSGPSTARDQCRADHPCLTGDIARAPPVFV